MCENTRGNCRLPPPETVIYSNAKTVDVRHFISGLSTARMPQPDPICSVSWHNCVDLERIEFLMRLAERGVSPCQLLKHQTKTVEIFSI